MLVLHILKHLNMVYWINHKWWNDLTDEEAVWEMNMNVWEESSQGKLTHGRMQDGGMNHRWMRKSKRANFTDHWTSEDSWIEQLNDTHLQGENMKQGTGKEKYIIGLLNISPITEHPLSLALHFRLVWVPCDHDHNNKTSKDCVICSF